jgi:hypothetical protein
MIKPNPTPKETKQRKPRVPFLMRTSCDRSDVERQEIDMEDVRDEHNLDITKVVRLEGVSGVSTLNDAQVQEILDTMSRRDTDGLGLSALDRLFRMGDEFGNLRILDPFRKYHKTIYSAREGVVEPWTPEGKKICMTAATESGSERSEIRRRTMNGKLRSFRRYQKLIEEGRMKPEDMVMSGIAPPYGYRYDRADRGGFVKLSKKRGKWVIYESEAEVVRMIFRMAAFGVPDADGVPNPGKRSGYAIADWLNARGIRTNRGNQWAARVVRGLIRNTAYIGRAKYTFGAEEAARDRKNGVVTDVIEMEIPCAAILTGEQVAWFDKANASIAKNFRGRPSRQNYLAQGRIYCALCGERITGKRQTKKYTIYHCSNRDTFTHKRECKACQVGSEKFDRSLWNGMLDGIEDPNEVAERIRRYGEAQAKLVPFVRNTPAEKIEKLRRVIANAERIIKDAELPDMWDDAKKDKLDAQSEIAVIEYEQKSAKTVFHRPPRVSIEEFCAQVRLARGWTEHTEKRGLFERIVTRVEYDSRTREWTAEVRMPYTAASGNSIKSGGQKWDGCVGADPQRQGADRRNGKARRLAEHPDGVLQVLQNIHGLNRRRTRLDVPPKNRAFARRLHQNLSENSTTDRLDSVVLHRSMLCPSHRRRAPPISKPDGRELGSGAH